MLQVPETSEIPAKNATKCLENSELFQIKLHAILRGDFFPHQSKKVEKYISRLAQMNLNPVKIFKLNGCYAYLLSYCLKPLLSTGTK